MITVNVPSEVMESWREPLKCPELLNATRKLIVRFYSVRMMAIALRSFEHALTPHAGCFILSPSDKRDRTDAKRDRSVGLWVE